MITSLVDYEDHCGQPKRADAPLPEMAAEELRDIIESGAPRPILVDVREPFEVLASRLPYLHHIPLGAFAERYGEIDREADIVVYCKSGRRSSEAAKLLIAHGYPRVRNLAGGIDAFLASKARIESSL